MDCPATGKVEMIIKNIQKIEWTNEICIYLWLNQENIVKFTKDGEDIILNDAYKGKIYVKIHLFVKIQKIKI